VLKAMLTERLGIDCGDPRLPTLPLTSEQREKVISRAAALGVGRIAVGQSDN
jgi:dihydrodipicolinate synthase/N-acetylneuraminate lyase